MWGKQIYERIKMYRGWESEKGLKYQQEKVKNTVMQHMQIIVKISVRKKKRGEVVVNESGFSLQ